MIQKPPQVVDIGINLTNRELIKHWRAVIQRALTAGVQKILLTGTSVHQSRQGADLARTWAEETGTANLFCTIGVHPHNAKSYNASNSSETTSTHMNTNTTTEQLREMLLECRPFAVAVGECGLDYNRNFSSRNIQRIAFREQVRLACQLDLPLFVHEREAHEDLLEILDGVNENDDDNQNDLRLPPVVIHCFTGTEEEAQEYIRRGYYLGFTGTICKKERGKHLREMLPKLPLNKIMIETDAPYMGFKKGIGRRGSEPSDVVDVAKKLSEVLDVPFETVCEETTKNAISFFRLEQNEDLTGDL